MASSILLDCNCPQYVDFLAGLNNSGDSFFGETDASNHSKLGLRTPCSKESSFSCEKGNFPTELDGEKSPPLSSKHPSKSVATVPFNMAFPLKRRSRSESCIRSKFTGCALKVPLAQKRSSSVNDLRLRKKTYATTPMCLKRTLGKSKTKKIKSTEEMELEKIAELQKQLSDHLRFNERTLRKLKLQPRTVIPKSAPLKRELNTKNSKKNLKSQISATVPCMKALDAVTNHLRSKFQKDIGKTGAVKSGMKTNKEIKPKQPESEKPCSTKMADEREKFLKHRPLPIKYGFHSGLTLVEKPKKTIMVKPFNFDAGLKNPKNENKVERPFLNSLTTPQAKGKENIFLNKMASYSEVKFSKKHEKLLGAHSINKDFGRSDNTLKVRNKI